MSSPASDVRGPIRPRISPWVPLALPAGLLSLVLIGSIGVLLPFSFFAFEQGRMVEVLGLSSWARTLGDSFFWGILGRTLQLALLVTALDLLIGFPTAYAITKVRNPVILILAYGALFSPLVVSIVVRSYGWLFLLSDSGVVNSLLQQLGITSAPIHLIYSVIGVQIAMVHGFLPLMVFPLMGVIRQLPVTYKEAALDLGANRIQTFLRVVLPLTLPGIIAGCQIVFVLAVASYVTPELMGGGRVIVASRLAWESVSYLDWPRGAIQVFILLGSTGVFILGTNILARRTHLGKLPLG